MFICEFNSIFPRLPPYVGQIYEKSNVLKRSSVTPKIRFKCRLVQHSGTCQHVPLWPMLPGHGHAQGYCLNRVDIFTAMDVPTHS